MAGKVIGYGDTKAERGEFKFGPLKAVELPDGTPINFPLMILNGKHEGPVLTLVSTMHGQEITGIEVIRRIVREKVKAENLKGAIVAIPIGNPLAYHHSAYVTPYDSGNMAKSFPGRPAGFTTSRMASTLWQVIQNSDCYIDLHCIPLAVPHLIVNRYSSKEMEGTVKKSLELAKAFGFPILMKRDNEIDQSFPMSCANAKGIPSFVVEFNDWKIWTKTNANRGMRGVLNVMKTLGMIEGKVEEQSDVPYPKGPFFSKLITANKGGIVHPTRELGQKVTKGEELARILNPYGDVVETVTAPVDGYVGSYCFVENQAIPTGDYVVFIWHTDDSFFG